MFSLWMLPAERKTAAAEFLPVIPLLLQCYYSIGEVSTSLDQKSPG